MNLENSATVFDKEVSVDCAEGAGKQCFPKEKKKN